ncbi:MAG: T9SS type A sorting domain-containing protein, partial [Bacteroidales bacterium]|nr:T9SS type A sorting domain-containing protein [Bacteroidales bacterium]
MKKITQLAFSIAYLASTTNQYYPISIKEITSQPQFTLQLKTNPVKDKIQFTYTSTNSQDTRFQIINQMGKIEKEGKLFNHRIFSSQYSIPIPHLKQGIYLLKIENQVEKIIVVSPLP